MMKCIVGFAITLSATLLGCGSGGSGSLKKTDSQNSFVFSTQSTAVIPSASPSTSCSGMRGLLSTPAPGLVGASTQLSYNSHSYLISTHSSSASKNTVGALAGGGTFSVCFTGTFSSETGMFPNPTAYFDVVIFQTISLL